MRDRTIRRQAERARKASGQNKPSTYRPGIWALCLLLAIGTLILYSPVRGHDFINFDDAEYVTENSHVTAGLSLQTVRWSFASNEQCNWHPLTWLSHALDYQLFGSDAGYHHFSSVIIHVLNVLLLFLLLQHATGNRMPSFLVAALFAWHPFNVESVAWVAERKNVLSTLWFLLALIAYYRYAQHPRIKSLALVAGIFVLALMSKPMAVTFPFVLVLLDYWPLRRVRGWTEPRPETTIPQHSVSRLLLEKSPLFALSVASSVVTVWAQRSCGALRTFKAIPFAARLENAVYSYLLYVWKTLWPMRFALFYPRAPVPVWKLAIAAALLGAISVAVWKQRASRPYLIVGWLWFVGTLIPVIGVVQVGDQAMADRYAYLPTIGLFIMIVWGALDLFDSLHLPNAASWTSASVLLVVLWYLTFVQVGYWQDSATVWTHTLRVTSGNSQAENKLAFTLSDRGDTEQALPHFINGVNIDPTDIGARVNLGVAYAKEGRLPDAIDQLEFAIKLTDGKTLSANEFHHRCSAFIDLGFTYTLSRNYPKALLNFESANQSDPLNLERTAESIQHVVAARPSEVNYLNLSLLLRAEGKNKEALSVLEDAIQANPGYAEAIELLNFLNANQT